jgi:hypothetical protein
MGDMSAVCCEMTLLLSELCVRARGGVVGGGRCVVCKGQQQAHATDTAWGRLGIAGSCMCVTWHRCGGVTRHTCDVTHVFAARIRASLSSRSTLMAMDSRIWGAGGDV